MKVIPKKILGTFEIIPNVYLDDRGCFYEIFRKDKYETALGIEIDIVQLNYSKSNFGVVRGLHFQKKFPQAKLVKVNKGKIFDVVVDLRKNSKTYLQWDSIILEANKRNQFWVPQGLAHGFLSLEENTEVEYLCTDIYRPEDEECLKWDDNSINIEWPVPMTQVTLSKKDLKGKALSEIIDEK
tara:strand:- start:2588 stop:3136 length:549 start_codon:yes stop_codon:yes gene_type:complete